MNKNRLSPRELALSASLATISAIVQLIHIGYQSPQFGMWVDVVTASWVTAFFLFGVRGALLTSILGMIFLTLFAPETWLGASMKWLLSAPIWLSLSFWLQLTKKPLSAYGNVSYLILPTIFALVIRCIIALPLNYYFAIPIWLGIPAAKAIDTIPWYLISGFNFIQGLLDVTLAWLITFRFNLKNFASWEN